VKVDVGDLFVGKKSQTPGYRALFAKACNAAGESAPCSIHSLAIMTYPSSFNGGTRTPI